MITNTDIVSAEVVDAAYRLHRDLGPGMLESVYEQLLSKKLRGRGLKAERQRKFRLEYDGLTLEHAFKVDILVNECVVVEVKAVERVLPVHLRQTHTYLRVLGLEVGLLLNFGAHTMKEGTRRVVNGYRATPLSRIRIEQG